MKAKTYKRQGCFAMTLIELLLVVVVFFVLAAMLMPVSPHQGRLAKKIKAQFEMADLANAVESYEAEYNRLPLANSATNKDVTYGISSADIQGFKAIDGTSLIAAHSDLILVLMDMDSGANAGHQLNPKQIKFLNPKIAADAKSSGFSSIDHQYRDPWGNPYVVSLDASLDGGLRDAVVSCQDLFANHAPTTLMNTNGIYAWRGKVMVWSRGQDGKANMSVPANDGANKDNLVGWK